MEREVSAREKFHEGPALHPQTRSGAAVAGEFPRAAGQPRQRARAHSPARLALRGRGSRTHRDRARMLRGHLPG